MGSGNEVGRRRGNQSVGEGDRTSEGESLGRRSSPGRAGLWAG